MGGDDDADLRHLTGAVGPGFVGHHHHLIAQQHRGAHRAAGAPGQPLCPDRHPRSQFQRVEVDVAESQRRRAQPVTAGVGFLLDHAVGQQGAHQSVHGGGSKIDGGGDLAETHPAAAAEHGQDAQRAVHRLDHQRATLSGTTLVSTEA